MKILILGGTGVLSTDFTKRVLDAGCQTTIVNRGRRKTFLDERARLICADLRAEDKLQLQKKMVDTDYDAVVDFLSYRPEHLEKTLSVIAGHFRHYLFISSATAYKKSTEKEIITENTPVGNEKWDYAYQKALCEQALAKHHDFHYTIIRPYVTYGDSRIPFPIIPNGYHYTLIKRIKEGKPVPLYEDGKALCTLTHTKDFAEVLFRLLLNEKAYGEAFHITGPYVQTWKEVYITLCRILHCEPNSFSVSSVQVKNYLPEFYDILQGDKGTNMVFDNTKVMQAIGDFQFAISPEKGLGSSVHYYEATPCMQIINNKWDGRIDYLFHRCTQSTQRLHCMSQEKVKGVEGRHWYYAMRFAPLNRMYNVYWKYKNR